MKTASIIFNADCTMTLVCGEVSTHFDSLSVLINYCRDNCIEVIETHTIQ